MTFLRKMERKYGKYAISNLPLYMIICYAIGYVLQIAGGTFVVNYLSLDPYAIFHGQVWRLVTWILVPPDSLDIFTLIMLYFYYSIGRSLESVWGTFLFNVYIFMGVIFTVIGALSMYAVFQMFIPEMVLSQGTGIVATLNQAGALAGMPFKTAEGAFYWYASNNFSTYYICQSIFLAYAITFPNAMVYLMMVIPIRVKVLGIIYAIILGYNVITAGSMGLIGVPTQVAILSSLLNAIIFFVITRKGFKTPKQRKRQREFKKKMGKVVGITRHKCAICGRTEVDNPGLEFRFCSKCNGNYEYCIDHLYTHKHVE